jgi:hypothetical protein
MEAMEHWQLVIRHRGALVLLLMTALASAGCATQASEKVMGVAPRPQRVDPVPTTMERDFAPQVTADEMYVVYNRSLIIGANANQKYLNRLLRVNGVFEGVNRNLPGRTYLELKTHDEHSFVYAALSKDAKPLLSKLVPGEAVELLCWGDSGETGNPFLRDCRR